MLINFPFFNPMNLFALFQTYLDRVTPFKLYRWLVFFIIFAIYFLRVFIISRYYLITYCLAIYMLHGLIEFLTPKEENIPDPFENFDDDVYIPQNVDDDEFRPFIRRMPEFNFWLFSMKLVILAFFSTFIGLFDIPVYVPILVIYFIAISGLTARNLYKHMRKYRYNPFFVAKDQYQSRA